MRLSGHLAIDLTQSADAFADVVDTHIAVCIAQENPRIGIEKRTRPGLTSTLRAIPHSTSFFAEMPAGSSAQKIPAFGTPHLGVRNFHRERIDHRIAIQAHLI